MDYKHIIKNYMKDDKIDAYPSKRKYKIACLFYLAEKFDDGIVYTEKQVNAILNDWHNFGDPATLRRELYDYRFLDRTADCREYRKEKVQPNPADYGLE